MTEADTSAAAARGYGSLEEGVDAFWRDAGTFVLHGEDCRAAVVANGERDFATAWREGDRVQQQVRQNLQGWPYACDLFMPRGERIDHEFDTTTSALRGDAGDGGCRCCARACLARSAISNFSTDCLARDAVADARVRARDFERVALRTVG